MVDPHRRRVDKIMCLLFHARAREFRIRGQGKICFVEPNLAVLQQNHVLQIYMRTRNY